MRRPSLAALPAHQCQNKQCALAQAIIGNYAVPVLEEKQVWGTSDDTRTAYLDSQVLPALSQIVLLLCVVDIICVHHQWLQHNWRCSAGPAISI